MIQSNPITLSEIILAIGTMATGVIVISIAIRIWTKIGIRTYFEEKRKEKEKLNGNTGRNQAREIKK